MDAVLTLVSAFFVLAFTWFFATFVGKAQKRTAAAATVVQILTVLLAVFSIVLLFLPAMPCEPMEISLGRRGHAHVTVDTWNLALPFLLSILLFSVTMFSYVIYRMTPASRKQDEGRTRKKAKKHTKRNAEVETLTAGQKIGLSLIALFFGAASALVIYTMLRM